MIFTIHFGFFSPYFWKHPNLGMILQVVDQKKKMGSEVRGMRHGHGIMTWPEGSRSRGVGCGWDPSIVGPLRSLSYMEL